MTVLATATISGHEARGSAALVRGDDGTITLEIRDLAIAPGAPDVRLYLSREADGSLGSDPIELGMIADSDTAFTRPLANDVDAAEIGSVVVHCTVYSVLFGHGVFEHAARSTDGLGPG